MILKYFLNANLIHNFIVILTTVNFITLMSGCSGKEGNHKSRRYLDIIVYEYKYALDNKIVIVVFLTNYDVIKKFQE